MGKFKDWWRSDKPPAPPQGPLSAVGNDWVVLPYRLAEACRLSLYTVGCHPDIPENIRVWIAQWLYDYNTVLAGYFARNYGPDIFDVLKDISDEVQKLTDEVSEEKFKELIDETFSRWEEQLKGAEGDDKPA